MVRLEKVKTKKFVSSTLLLLTFLLTHLLTLSSCGGGDDDGRRLGELIVGTWQRGWGEGDVVIEGDTDLGPDNFTYDQFVFHNDGAYNGMVRKGTFVAYDYNGDIIYEGDYQCDNNNLKLQFFDENNTKRTILAQVVEFSDTSIRFRYEEEQHNITVTFIIRKLSNESGGYYSSSSTTSL